MKIDGPVRRDAVTALMDDLSAEVMRVKGIVHFVGEPGRHVLQRVGRRWTIDPLPPAGGNVAERSTLVFVGTPGSVDRDLIARALDAS